MSLWRLFKPRPIVKITLPMGTSLEIEKPLKEKFKGEYIVIVEYSTSVMTTKVEIIK